MRRRLWEAAIAVALEESVRSFLPVLLPYIWLGILIGLSLEVLNHERIRNVIVQQYGMMRRGARMASFILVGLIGFLVSNVYWWGIHSAFAALESKNKKETDKTSEAATSAPAPVSVPTPSLPAEPRGGRDDNRSEHSAESTQDRDLALLNESETVIDRFFDFVTSQGKLYNEAIKDVEQHAVTTPATQRDYQEWRMGIYKDQERKIYDELYHNDLVRLRRELGVRVPSAVGTGTNYDTDSPYFIYSDISRIWTAYRDRLAAEGKLVVTKRSFPVSPLSQVP